MKGRRMRVIKAATMIPKTGLFFIKGIFPKKNPVSTKVNTHNKQPIVLKIKKFFKGILPMPATNGPRVRIIGKKRDTISVIAPYFV